MTTTDEHMWVLTAPIPTEADRELARQAWKTIQERDFGSVSVIAYAIALGRKQGEGQ